MSLLSVRDLRVDFVTDGGVVQVLDGISLDVGAGEVVGLVGESGCGKTTLARAILGILPSGPARILGGEVRFRGVDLLRADAAVVNDRVRGRAITFIPQDPSTAFSPVFSVGTQITDLMKWKSPRAARDAGGRPCGPAIDGDASGPTGTPCWRRSARCRSPSRPGRCGDCLTSSPGASASGS
jgi:peptide/nickel transport system ATP-binding protein